LLGKPAEPYLDVQRAAHMRRTHELTRLKRSGGLTTTARLSELRDLVRGRGCTPMNISSVRFE
jgi:hypothetical protein